MPQVWDKGRPPVWIFRGRPYDLQAGIERNVWLATTDIETDEPFEGWLSFDGLNDRIRIPDHEDLDLDTFCTFGVRFRTDSLQTAMLMVKGDLTATGGAGTGGYGFALLSGGTVRAFVSDGSSRVNSESSETYADGEWHTLMAVLTISGFSTVLNLYYDGALVDNPPASAPLANEFDLLVGENQAGGQDFDGDIERLFLIAVGSSSSGNALLASRDLTKTVADDGPVASLVAAYPINEGYGTFVQDVSGNAHHGTLEAGATTVKWSTIAPPPMTVPGLLEDPFSVSSSLLRSGALSSHALPSFGAVRANNPDGELDHLARYSWDHRLTEQRLGLDGDLVTNYDVIWVGQAEQPDDTNRTEFNVAIRGVEDVFEEDLQQRRHQPGFEPYFIGDGVNNQIDFGDNLDRGSLSFIIGTAFRTTNAAAQALYTKKDSLAGTGAGYSLGLGSTSIRFDIADGSSNLTVFHIPAGGYNTGNRIAVVAAVNRSTNVMELYVNFYDGDGWQLLDSTSIAGLGSVSNAVNLFAGRTGSGNFLDGEIERLVMRSGASGAQIAGIQDDLDERYAEDVDASSLLHYVPLTENSGTLAGDLSPSSVHGTLSGDADPDKLWSGTPNGTKDIEGLPVPIVLGRKSVNVVRWVDKEKLIAQVADVSTIWNVFSVREGFVPLTEDTATTGDIFTNAPGAGHWRQQGLVIGGNAGYFIRLASQPTGTVTASMDETNVEANPASAYPAELARRIASRVTSSLVSGLAQLNTDAPYVSGAYWDQPIRARDALDWVLRGAGAHWTVDPRQPFDLNGELRILMFQAKDVSATTPVATYRLDPSDEVSDIAIDGFRQTGVAPVYKTVIVKHNRYGTVLSLSEPQELPDLIPPLPQIEFANAQHLLHEWRRVVRPETQAEIDAILAQFKGATDHETDTAIWPRSDARDEAQRLVQLHNRLNRTYRAELTGGLFTHWIGDVVDVVATRILSDGTAGQVTLRFLVVGVDDDADNSGTILDLWGGFEPA